MKEDLYTDEINYQTKLRIKLAMAAYSYEYLDKSMITDAEFDKLSREVDLGINTRRSDLDDFFRKEFNSSTGMWIHRHPDKYKIACLCEDYFKKK